MEDREKFIEILKKYKEKIQYKIYAYCIMDNHVHILIKEGNESLSKTMKRIGVSYVHWYNLKHGRSGHLFQDRFKSEVVEDDKYLLTVIRYIHQNPLKAGVVDNIENYKWSSHYEYIGKSNNLVNTGFALGIFADVKSEAINSYKKFMNENSDEKCLEIKEYKKFNDKEGLEVIKKHLSINSLKELRNLDKKERNEMLRSLKSIEGLSIRQIARLTGFTVNIVAKA